MVTDLIIAEQLLSARDPVVLGLRKLVKAKKAEFQRSLTNQKEA
jgi:hypothetical protein